MCSVSSAGQCLLLSAVSVFCDAPGARAPVLRLGSASAACRLAQCGISVPLVNCWPSESGSSCDVNIEYELQEDNLELNDVVITIPLP